MDKEEKLRLETKRVGLINDLIATNTVMEEIWKYHPDNPNKSDIKAEYDSLKSAQFQVEEELKEVDIKLQS
tara:strand:+ start:34 stop:246 length:213 start_codon:yes stop_codon:yes gene_type:complete